MTEVALAAALGEPALSPSTDDDATPKGHPTQGALFATLYAELREIARRELQRSGGAGTLSPTTVLHEAYLRLGRHAGATPASEAEFLAYASRVNKEKARENSFSGPFY